jgi:hypothetical protein
MRTRVWNCRFMPMFVMPGLVPGIHVLGDKQKQGVDGREQARP